MVTRRWRAGDTPVSIERLIIDYSAYSNTRISLLIVNKSDEIVEEFFVASCSYLDKYFSCAFDTSVDASLDASYVKHADEEYRPRNKISLASRNTSWYE